MNIVSAGPRQQQFFFSKIIYCLGFTLEFHCNEIGFRVQGVRMLMGLKVHREGSNQLIS